VAVGLLFLVGYRLGHHAGYSPWRMGVIMVMLGGMMVGMFQCVNCQFCQWRENFLAPNLCLLLHIGIAAVITIGRAAICGC